MELSGGGAVSRGDGVDQQGGGGVSRGDGVEQAGGDGVSRGDGLKWPGGDDEAHSGGPSWAGGDEASPRGATPHGGDSDPSRADAMPSGDGAALLGAEEGRALDGTTPPAPAIGGAASGAPSTDAVIAPASPADAPDFAGATAPGSASTPAPATAPGSATTPAPATTPGSATTPAPATTPGPATTPAPANTPDPATTPALADATALETLRRLNTRPRGLTEDEAGARLAEYGENTLPGTSAVGWPRLLLAGVRDPFTCVLLCLGLVSALVSSWGTATVILALVAVSCVLRASGERRADRSVAALRDLVAGTATVVRRQGPDGTPVSREVPAADLVPGDVIRLGPGDLVPADVRLLRAHGLTVHQAALTGESQPVAKHAQGPGEGTAPALASETEQDDTTPTSPVPPAVAASGAPESPAVTTPATPAPDTPTTPPPFTAPHLCFQGSDIATGTATAVVLATGARTRFAAAHAPPARPTGNAFDRSVHGISWVLIRFMLLTPPLVLMANAALRDRGLETLPFAVAVAVGLTPEMLPVIVTTCLARGASLLARSHNVIVKRLPALHDLGAVDVLCVDKTGTLTQDRPVLERGIGTDGGEDDDVVRWAAVQAWWTLQLAELPAPDALDEALLDAAGAVGEEYDGVDAVPFDPRRRIATAVVRGRRPGTHLLITKGAVDDVLARCDLTETERKRLLKLAATEADDGLRLLAVATAERTARTRPYTPADERGLTFRGLVAFRDALAPSAAEALRGLAARGISVRVLTGDAPGTAARACRDLGLDPGEPVTLGADGDVPEATVYSRCTPQDKARVVAALRERGHTVGFLGDGVNDAPALRAADVGIAPRTACAVARESADVVLGEKELTAVGHAVTAGRYSSGNIASYLRVTLSSNLGNVLAMLSAGLLLPFLPMLPAQVLVQNLCFDAAQLAFAYDRPSASALRRPTVLRPRSFLALITGFGALNAVADLTTFGILAYGLRGPDEVDDEAFFHSAWFTENLLTQALVMVLLRAGRHAVRGGRRPGPVGWAATVLIGVGLLLPPSPLGGALGMTGLPLPYYLMLGAVLLLYALALRPLARRQP
ncbi:magnesium-translocating P-type ATPase [Streptomyces niveiscabiei]|uniref:magnesium-translocating P-type ATPase n=2 Tax=Streptomyces niveiscabiei TaxID=164115 RepID=UPI003EBC7FE5